MSLGIVSSICTAYDAILIKRFLLVLVQIPLQQNI